MKEDKAKPITKWPWVALSSEWHTFDTDIKQLWPLLMAAWKINPVIVCALFKNDGFRLEPGRKSTFGQQKWQQNVTSTFQLRVQCLPECADLVHFSMSLEEKKGHCLITSSGLRPRLTISQPKPMTAAKGFTLGHEKKRAEEEHWYKWKAFACSCCLPATTDACLHELLLCSSLLHQWFVLNCSTAGTSWMKHREEAPAASTLVSAGKWHSSNRFQNERQDHEVSEAGNGGRCEQSFHAASANNSKMIEKSSLIPCLCFDERFQLHIKAQLTHHSLLTCWRVLRDAQGHCVPCCLTVWAASKPRC